MSGPNPPDPRSGSSSGSSSGAHLAALRRTACGDISVEQSTPLDEILEMDRDQLRAKVVPINRFS